MNAIAIKIRPILVKFELEEKRRSIVFQQETKKGYCDYSAKALFVLHPVG